MFKESFHLYHSACFEVNRGDNSHLEETFFITEILNFHCYLHQASTDNLVLNQPKSPTQMCQACAELKGGSLQLQECLQRGQSGCLFTPQGKATINRRLSEWSLVGLVQQVSEWRKNILPLSFRLLPHASRCCLSLLLIN